MLILERRRVGENLRKIRRRAGLNQQEAAEAAGLSSRAYADIERGSANMRADTILGICQAFHVTPNDLFTEEDSGETAWQRELMTRLRACSPQERRTALRLLSVYLDSLA